MEAHRTPTRSGLRSHQSEKQALATTLPASRYVYLEGAVVERQEHRRYRSTKKTELPPPRVSKWWRGCGGGSLRDAKNQQLSCWFLPYSCTSTTVLVSLGGWIGLVEMDTAHFPCYGLKFPPPVGNGSILKGRGNNE